MDGPVFHNLGASAGWELAGVLAAGVEYLRLLTEAGLGSAESLRQIGFRLAADDDQFMTIAKFRAARLLWGRVAEAMGQPDSGGVRLHAVTSLPMMTQRDPWVNMLRTTVAAFGAGVGERDTVRVLPFDAAIPGGYPGVQQGSPGASPGTRSYCFWRSRISDGSVTPQAVPGTSKTSPKPLLSRPGRISSRSRSGADSAWLATSSSTGSNRWRVTAQPTSRIGVPPSPGSTSSPNLAEPALPQFDSIPSEITQAVERYASPFEALRNRSDMHLERTGARPRMLLLPLGPLSEHNIRATFAVNLLASGGIEAVNPGTVGASGVSDVLTGDRGGRVRDRLPVRRGVG